MKDDFAIGYAERIIKFTLTHKEENENFQNISSFIQKNDYNM
jgi:hypothetical protein